MFRQSLSLVTNNTMGFPESMFVQDPPTDLTCPICFEVLQDPASPCGHSFCKDCLTEYLKDYVKCPFSCDYNNLLVPMTTTMSNSRPSNLIVVRRLNKMLSAPTQVTLKNVIGNLAVTCRQGTSQEDQPPLCAWSGTLTDWTDIHLPKHCEFVLVPCPNADCPHRSNRGDAMERHKLSCYYRLVTCPYASCGSRITKKNLEQHKTVCPFYETTCNACAKRLLRKDVFRHQQQSCPRTVLICPNRQCTRRCTRQKNGGAWPHVRVRDCRLPLGHVGLQGSLYTQRMVSACHGSRIVICHLGIAGNPCWRHCLVCHHRGNSLHWCGWLVHDNQCHSLWQRCCCVRLLESCSSGCGSGDCHGCLLRLTRNPTTLVHTNMS